MFNTSILYPALVYKSNKRNVFVANCIIKKLIGYGRTECDAISNLEKILNSKNPDYPIKVKPVYKILPDLPETKQSKGKNNLAKS